MVARDGIEPPTPAFSGPRSTTELSGLGESKDAASAYVVSESAASGGGPGQVSNCAQATNVSIAIASLCANFPPANPGARRLAASPPCRTLNAHPELLWSLWRWRTSCGILNESRTRSQWMEPYTKSGSQFTFEYIGSLRALCPDTVLPFAGPSMSPLPRCSAWRRTPSRNLRP